LQFHISKAYPPWIIRSNFLFVLLLGIFQHFKQPARSRRRQGDCRCPESEQERAKHRVRNQISNFQISHIPEAYPPRCGVPAPAITHSGWFFALSLANFAVSTTINSVQKEDWLLRKP
jgi:hypothetical protein